MRECMAVPLLRLNTSRVTTSSASDGLDSAGEEDALSPPINDSGDIETVTAHRRRELSTKIPAAWTEPFEDMTASTSVRNSSGALSGPRSIGHCNLHIIPSETTSSLNHLKALLRQLAGTNFLEELSQSSPVEPHSVTRSSAPDVLTVARTPDEGVPTGEEDARNGSRAEKRLSLPDRLRSRSDPERRSQPLTKRRNSVKFADQVGMNLSFFAMIPPRQSAGTKSAVPSNRYKPVPPEIDDALYSGWSLPFKPSAKDGYPHHFSRYIHSEGCTGSCAYPANSVSPVPTELDLFSQLSLQPSEPESTLEPGQFRLCFEQPFVNLDRLHNRLATQYVCLENVRVANMQTLNGNFAPHLSQSNPGASNSVIVCVIKVRNLAPVKKVFGRCTDDDWQTMADLPAQDMDGEKGAEYEYNRYSFALHKPATAEPSSSDVPSLGDRSQDVRAVVEFAVCCQVAGKSYWDNNDGRNYRIEWF